MGFWTLFEVASMPILQVLLISVLGAFLATDYCNILSTDTRRSLNKLVFVAFTPSLIFASLVKSVTFQDIISWWFMPINVALTFIFGIALGWLLIKILKPLPHLEGLIVAVSSSGNLGNLPIILVPAMCHEDESPFAGRSGCSLTGLSYASFSMALGGFFIWTVTYQQVRTSAAKFKALEATEKSPKNPNEDLHSSAESSLLKGIEVPDSVTITVASTKPVEHPKEKRIAPVSTNKREKGKAVVVKDILYGILHELMAPPTVAAIMGFVFGATTWVKNLLIGDDAPLRVIQDSIALLGDGTIPCITLILGGNLVQGLRSSTIKPSVIIGVVCIRYIIQPIIGICVVKAAGNLGLLPSDPLFHFVLMLQFSLPPATNIGTMTQLFDVGQEECSVLFFWTYLVAALALTGWSTIFMWILS